MLDKYALKGQPAPIGPYRNAAYYWEKGEIKQSASGPSLVIPPFVIDARNVDDRRLWGNIAYNDWSLHYK